MTKKAVEVSVATVFTGKQNQQQAFIDLILYKRRNTELKDMAVENASEKTYNDDKVFSDVRVG